MHHGYCCNLFILFTSKTLTSEINNDCHFYVRYIDDTFLIYTSKEIKRNNFFTNKNMIRDSLQFNHEKINTITFLDTLIYVDKKRHLQRTLDIIPTNTSITIANLLTPNSTKKALLPLRLIFRFREKSIEIIRVNIKDDALAQSCMFAKNCYLKVSSLGS